MPSVPSLRVCCLITLANKVSSVLLGISNKRYKFRNVRNESLATQILRYLPLEETYSLLPSDYLGLRIGLDFFEHWLLWESDDYFTRWMNSSFIIKGQISNAYASKITNNYILHVIEQGKTNCRELMYGAYNLY